MKNTIQPYLTFNGNCREAFNFYKSVFKGEFEMLSIFADMPPQDGMEVSDALKDKIMHVSLRINGETVLMGSDNGGDWAPEIHAGNNFSLSVTTQSKEEADEKFNALVQGGNITMPIASTFWGDYFGMCTDRFGISWMIGFNEGSKA